MIDSLRLDRIDNKDDVVTYADELGLSGLNKQRSLKNLKTDLVEAYSAKTKEETEAVITPDTINDTVSPTGIATPDTIGEASVVEDTPGTPVGTEDEIDILSLAHGLSLDTVVDTAPIKGGDSILITHPTKGEETIEASALEYWCKENGVAYKTAVDLLVRYWLNVHGYSFKHLK